MNRLSPVLKKIIVTILALLFLLYGNLMVMHHMMSDVAPVDRHFELGSQHVSTLLNRINEISEMLEIERNSSSEIIGMTKIKIAALVDKTIDIKTDLEKSKVSLEDAQAWSKLSQTNFEKCVSEKYQVQRRLSTCENNQRQLNQPVQKIDEYKDTFSVEPSGRNDRSVTNSTSTRTKDDLWLVVTVPSLVHTFDNTHLIDSLDSLAAQLPSDPYDLLFDKVLIFVINVQPLESPRLNKAFFAAQLKYADGVSSLSSSHSQKIHRKARYFRFIDNSGKRENLLTDAAVAGTRFEENGTMVSILDDAGKGLDSSRIRQHLLESIRVIEQFQATTNTAIRYVMLLEEDSNFCANGLIAMEYILNKATLQHPDWLLLMTTNSIKGSLMRQQDVQEFSHYLRSYSKPVPDHLYKLSKLCPCNVDILYDFS